VKKKLYPWLIWLLGSTFMFYKFAIEVSPSVMTSDLMSTFQINATDLGNLAASYFYAYLLLQIPAGLLVDRFGPRKVTSIAILVCALGTWIFSCSESLAWATTGRFLSGAGAAFAAINCLKLIGNWFPKNQFAFMAGLMMTVGMLGAVCGQAPLAQFIKMMEWREALFWISGAGFLLSLLFFCIIRDGSKESNSSLKGLKVTSGLKQILLKPQAWLLSIYSGLAFAPVSIFGGLWGVPFMMQNYGFEQIQAANLVSLIFIGFAIGAPIAGWFSNFFGFHKPVMYWGISIALLSITAILYIPLSLPLLTLSLLIFGASISCFLLCFTMIREINTPILAATSVGFMNAFDALFGALSDPLTGKFLDMGWKGEMLNGARLFPIEVYKVALFTLPAYLLVSLILLIFIKETHTAQVTNVTSTS